MDLPPNLEWLTSVQPQSAPFSGRLSEHSEVEVLHVLVDLVPWVLPVDRPKPIRADTYGWKPQVVSSHHRLERSVGEVEIAQRFRSCGLNAAWTDGFGSAPEVWRPWICRAKELPPFLAEIEREIRRHKYLQAFPRGGLPDVLVWSRESDRWYCVEYKGPSGSNPRKQDKVQPSQDAWYRAGKELGFLNDFNYVVAKWEPTSNQVRLLELQKAWRL